MAKAIVLNKEYGGFSLSDMAVEALGLESIYDLDDYEDRSHAGLIELIKREGSKVVSGRYAELHIVEIPDDATDWTIEENDGFETLIYVVDGKLHFA